MRNFNGSLTVKDEYCWPSYYGPTMFNMTTVDTTSFISKKSNQNGPNAIAAISSRDLKVPFQTFYFHSPHSGAPCN